MHQSELRGFMAGLEREILALERADAGAERGPEGIRRTFDALSRYLNVGPEPKTRHCPACGSEILKDASRCMHCWAKSAAPAEASGASKDE
jgi:hypothetical protein